MSGVIAETLTRFSSKRLAVAVSAILFILNYLVGNLDFPGANSSDSDWREFAGAIAMPSIIGYFWVASIFVTNKGVYTIAIFIKNTSFKKSQRNFYRLVDTISKQNFIAAVIMSITMTVSYLHLEGLFATDLEPGNLLLNLITPPFWFFVCFFILQITRLTLLVIRHYLNKTTVDIFGLQRVSPLSEFVVNNTVLSAIGFMLIPLFWIGRAVPVIDIVITTTIMLVVVLYLFLPVFRVQRIISHKKEMALERLNISLNQILEKSILKDGDLTKDANILRELSSLVSTKSEISSVSEWPINLPQGFKVFFFTLSVPMSMIAASLVDWIMKSHI